MQPSRLWTLFFVGSAVITVAVILLFDLSPNASRRPRLTGEAPARTCPSRAGLVVYMAGGQSAASDAIEEAFARTKADRGFIAVDGGADPLDAVRNALAEHDIDQRRVFLITRTIAIEEAADVMAGSNIWAGAQCWVGRGEARPELSDRSLPAYVMVVAGESNGVKTAVGFSSALAEAGVRVVYRQLEGGVGTELQRQQREKDVLDDAIVWFTTLRNERIAVRAKDSERLAEIARTRWSRLTREDFDEMARVGGPSAAGYMLRALDSESDKYRIAASARCKGTWFGQDVFERLTTLLTDPNEIVRLQVIDALALLARWQNAEAQDALCRAALDPRISVKDRAAIVRELAESVRLDVPLGIAVENREGKGRPFNVGGVWVLRTFLGLLASDEPALRRAAEGAIWMWKVPEAGGEGSWCKRYADSLYESLMGDPAERRSAIPELKKWAAETYPASFAPVSCSSRRNSR